MIGVALNVQPQIYDDPFGTYDSPEYNYDGYVRTVGITSDGLVKYIIDETITTDGLIATPIEFTTDGFMKIPGDEIISTDGIVFATNDFNFDTDGSVKDTLIETITTDGYVQITRNKNFTSDGRVFTFNDELINTDGIIHDTINSPIDVDGIVLTIVDESFNTDGFINVIGEETFETDGIIKTTGTSGPVITTDALVEVPKDVLYPITVDGIVKEDIPLPFTTDAWVITAVPISTDGIIKRGKDKSFSTDADVAVGYSKLFSTDALITYAGVIRTDGIVFATNDLEITTDGIVVKPGAIITFRDDDDPSIELTSLIYYQQKYPQGNKLPVKGHEISNIIRFRIYNNYDLELRSVDAFNVSISAYDDYTATTENNQPVKARWIRLQEIGYGEGSVAPGNLTDYIGEDLPIKGKQEPLIPERGSDGGPNPVIRGRSDYLMGFIRFKTYAELPPQVIPADYDFVIVIEYDFII
jgi:hypothetical protein